MERFSDTEISITMTGAEWALLLNLTLSEPNQVSALGAETARQARQKLADALTAEARRIHG